MPPNTPENGYFPNKIGRILLLGLEEVIGVQGVERILETARLPHLIGNYPENNLNLKFSFDALSSILSAMEELYGLQGGRGLACRAGRACPTAV